MLTIFTPVKNYMTKAPTQANEKTTLLKAIRTMRAENIRHLPVNKDGKLYGLVTHRDIVVMLAKKPDVDVEQETVVLAMTRNPYVASPDTPLGEVCSKMARHKYGSVVIVENERAVGIFTAVDALLVLSQECSKGSRYSGKY